MTFFRHRKFTLLLLSLLLLMGLHPTLNASRAVLTLLYYVFLAFTFFGVLLVLFQRKQSRLTALVLGTPTLVGLTTGYFVPALPPTVASILFHLFPVFFLAYTIVTILTTVLVESEVSSDSVNGAFCGYLLIALAFGHLYCLTEAFRPGSFLITQEQLGPLPTDEDRRHSLLTYFSLLTLTTVGYGDIIPRSPPARSLAWMEAVIGQFYVAVIIAQLIGMKVSAALSGRRPDEPASTDKGRS
jgi:hypothetical protein